MTEFERVRALVAADRLRLGIHIRRMNSPGSAVYRPAENVLPLGGVLLASVGLATVLGWGAGLVVALAGGAWWLWRVQPRIRDGVYARSLAFSLATEPQFDAMWRAGVLSLYAKLPDGTEYAATRRDDWRVFVAALPEP